MRGRPRKIFLDRDAPVQITGRVKKWIRDLIPHDANISHDFESYILVKYGDADRSQLESLKMKEIELREELSSVRGRILVIEARMKQEEELRRSMEIQIKYCAEAFRVLMGIIKKNHGSSITMKEEFISRIYGISFNRQAVNDSWDDLTDIQEWPDEMLIEKFDIRKQSKGEREDEIMKTVIK